MNSSLVSALGLAACLVAGSAVAQESALAVGGQLGTPGAGATVQYSVSPKVVLRGTVDVLSYDEDFSSDDVGYSGELDWTQGGVFVDLHPWSSPLFVSGGAYFGGRDVDFSATSGRAAEIGNVVFTPEQIGTLEGEADFGDAAPFVGLGWNNTFHTDNRFGFRATLGAAFGSDPEVTLRRTGGVVLPAAVAAQLNSELRNEERELEDDAADLKIFPVVQLGLTYRF